jgi:trimethylamine corrinoid protein
LKKVLTSTKNLQIMTEQILSDLREAVLYYDPEEAKKLAQKALDMGVDPVVALEEGLARPLREIGDRFGTGEAFITELIAAAQAMEAGAEVLNQEIARRGATRKKLGTFLIGTVEGDIHSIGKNIVATMLSTAGFEVIDLGTDVPTQTFIDNVKKHHPDILGLSALMTTTMTKQKEVIEALKAAGLREGLKIIVGGAPVTEDWVKEIGADACGLDALNAVEASLRLMEGT